MTKLQLITDDKKVSIDITIDLKINNQKGIMDFVKDLTDLILENSKNVPEFERYSIIRVNTFKYF